ncbi:MAG: molybdopterin-dependent oxidoreductase [Actinomycetota bacterium]|nr:molybdopterin-dependent oxidoreductase [Actinomycetota bacterium]
MEQHPPPGPFRRTTWRSPLRGPWLTGLLGLVLLVGIPVVFATGLLSYAAYNPDLHPLNDQTPDKGLLGFYLFAWPTQPRWLYRLNQGVHVTLALALIPVVLAKLWSVIPKLFDWPPATSPAQVLERLSLFLLVGGAVFELATGVLNVQNWYVFPFSFYPAHFYGAWVFMGAFVVHAGLKLARAVSGVRGRGLPGGLHREVDETSPERPDPDALVSPRPASPTMSRRGVLGLVGGSALLLGGLTVGQSLGGRWRATAVLAPRGLDAGSGPNGFPVNKTAAAAGIRAEQVGLAWRLELLGPTRHTLRREELLALPQHTAALPIACVEGWSTEDQQWTGVRLRDLAALAGLPSPAALLVESLQQGGDFASAVLRGNQVLDPDSLLALRVNGADLSLDHGFPARVIVPANPGVHNTKWVARMRFLAEA